MLGAAIKERPCIVQLIRSVEPVRRRVQPGSLFLSVSFTLHLPNKLLSFLLCRRISAVNRRYLLWHLLTARSRVLLEKLTSKLCSWSRNSPHLWNPKVPHNTHKCPPPVPILSQLHPVPMTSSNFLKIHLNIILPSTSWSPQWPLSLRLPHQHPVDPSILPHTHHMPCPSHTSRFYHPHNIG